MIFDIENSLLGDSYQLMAQTIIPRPIAWVVTEDAGVINIAPFSYFIGLSSNPATVLISVGEKSNGTPKDTLANIRKHKKCTICMVDAAQLEKMHLSAQELDHSVSEATTYNIEMESLFDAFPPMIEGVPCAYFCDFNQEIDLGGSATIPLILNVKQIYVKDGAVEEGERITINFDPVARIGKSYASLGEELIVAKA